MSNLIDLEITLVEKMSEEEFEAVLDKCVGEYGYRLLRNGDPTGCVLISVEYYQRLVGEDLVRERYDY